MRRSIASSSAVSPSRNSASRRLSAVDAPRSSSGLPARACAKSARPSSRSSGSGRICRSSVERFDMTLRQPPSIAGQLLKRLVPAHDHDALLGDLYEEYQRDRSAFWYWAQIVAAIVVDSFKDMRVHWVLALRSIAIGVASFLAYFQVVGIW